MPDEMWGRIRYGLGNVVRFLSAPWRERNIDPADATTIFGCGFGGAGWHHLRATLRELEADPSLPVEQTSAWRYLTNFRPSSISTLAGVTDEPPLPLFVYPWGTFGDGAATIAKDPFASRFCGPSTPEFIREEIRRTLELRDMMRRTGYRPYRYPHSFIGGVWLIANDGQRRFVVLQGNHRMTILAHLGVRDIAVRSVDARITTVREADIARWPLVLAGRCSESHARKIFRMFFEQDGHHVLAQLPPR